MSRAIPFVVACLVASAVAIRCPPFGSFSSTTTDFLDPVALAHTAISNPAVDGCFTATFTDSFVINVDCSDRTAVTFCENGVINFESKIISTFPTVTTSTCPNRTACVLYSNWNISDSGTMYWNQTTVDSLDAVVFTWHRMANTVAGGVADFQLVIWADGSMQYNFNDTTLDTTSVTLGKTAIVGINGHLSGSRVPYSAYGSAISDQFSIARSPDGVQVSPHAGTDTETTGLIVVGTVLGVFVLVGVYFAVMSAFPSSTSVQSTRYARRTTR